MASIRKTTRHHFWPIKITLSTSHLSVFLRQILVVVKFVRGQVRRLQVSFTEVYLGTSNRVLLVFTVMVYDKKWLPPAFADAFCYLLNVPLNGSHSLVKCGKKGGAGPADECSIFILRTSCQFNVSRRFKILHSWLLKIYIKTFNYFDAFCRTLDIQKRLTLVSTK